MCYGKVAGMQGSRATLIAIQSLCTTGSTTAENTGYFERSEACCTTQEKQDDSWSSVYIRASPEHPRGGIVMKMENDYAIVSALSPLFCDALCSCSQSRDPPAAATDYSISISVESIFSCLSWCPDAAKKDCRDFTEAHGSGTYLKSHKLSVVPRAECLDTAGIILLATWRATWTSSSRCASLMFGR